MYPLSLLTYDKAENEMKTRRLTKEQLKYKQMGQVVAEDYHTKEIFVAFDFDYCCQGNKTVE